MDIVQLYQDYGVDFKSEGHKHCRPGWVNTECPFCTGNPGYHLGYEINNDHYFCWRCGWHPVDFTVSKLLNINTKETERILKSYGLLIPGRVKTPAIKTGEKPHRMPSNTTPLQKIHKKYLESRGFDYKYLEQFWGLVGTNEISGLDGISYKWRIIAPVIWDQQAVSFISRDVTNKSGLRYITCPKEREVIHHKHIVYGKQELWNKTGICVEGITDVWRFGKMAFCTFGIEYKNQQVRVIAKHFKRVFVAFDDDPQAVKQAKKLIADLKFRGVEAIFVPIVGDPASMDQKEANYLVSQFITNQYI